MNRTALRIAREVARESGSLLAGNICNTWVYDAKDPKRSSREVRRMYEEQVQWAVEGGADFILAETMDWFAEASIALEVIQGAGMPAVINFTSVQPRTSDDYDFPTACRIMAERGALVVGLHCGRGP